MKKAQEQMDKEVILLSFMSKRIFLFSDSLLGGGAHSCNVNAEMHNGGEILQTCGQARLQREILPQKVKTTMGLQQTENRTVRIAYSLGMSPLRVGTNSSLLSTLTLYLFSTLTVFLYRTCVQYNHVLECGGRFQGYIGTIPIYLQGLGSCCVGSPCKPCELSNKLFLSSLPS